MIPALVVLLVVAVTIGFTAGLALHFGIALMAQQRRADESRPRRIGRRTSTHTEDRESK